MVWPGGNWTREAEYFEPPDFVERKGSLYLRSNNTNYSRYTLNSDWHAKREAEPKDFDFAKTFKDKQALKEKNQNISSNSSNSSLSASSTKINKI